GFHRRVFADRACSAGVVSHSFHPEALHVLSAFYQPFIFSDHSLRVLFSALEDFHPKNSLPGDHHRLHHHGPSRLAGHTLSPHAGLHHPGDLQTFLPGISVVIPVYRSEAILPELLHRLSEVLPTLTPSYEVVLVNDASPDRSWEVICGLSEQYRWVHAINLMRNYGQHNALLCGIRATHYALVVTMDDDLQHPPEEIPKLLAVLEQGYDVVYGGPAQEQHGLMRDLASLTTKLALQSLMGAEIARQVSAFRVFRAEVANAFRHYEGAFVSIDVLLTW